MRVFWRLSDRPRAEGTRMGRAVREARRPVRLPRDILPQPPWVGIGALDGSVGR